MLGKLAKAPKPTHRAYKMDQSVGYIVLYKHVAPHTNDQLLMVNA